MSDESGEYCITAIVITLIICATILIVTGKLVL